MKLACPNCKKEVDEQDVKWFGGEGGQAAVFCCSTCHSIAERLYARGKAELTALLNMLKEGIRVSIADGRLHLPEGSPDGELSKREVLEAILQLKERSDARKAEKHGG